jgi:hypothetical protein
MVMSRHEVYPHDADGNPMRIITAGVTDTIPTVQYGSVKLFVSVTEAFPVGSRQDRINATRELQRDAEFCVGVERRLLQAAVDPTYKFVNPINGSEAFAAPPADYDHSSMPPHPADAANASSAEPAKS